MSTYEVTVPILWLKKASKQRGKALVVALALLQFVGCQLEKNIVAENKSVFSLWGLKPDAVRRGLRDLERANLVSVVRGVGNKKIVKIINFEPVEGESNGDKTIK